jgi:hypothetical protein
MLGVLFGGFGFGPFGFGVFSCPLPMFSYLDPCCIWTRWRIFAAEVVSYGRRRRLLKQ